MKKKILRSLLAAMVLGSGAVFAGDAAAPEVKMDSKNFKPFQIGFLPYVPSYTEYSTVNGFKLGAPMVTGWGYVNGLEASVLYSGTNNINGIQATLTGVSLATKVNGLQAATGFSGADELYGFQGSLVNYTKNRSLGAQGSVANISGEFDGFQAGAANTSIGDFAGFQFGVANTITKAFKGFQCGGFNIVTGLYRGFQCGIFNYSSEGGAQLGAINIIADAYIPVLPIANYSTFKEDPRAKKEEVKTEKKETTK